MQSGLGKTKKWVLEFFDSKSSINPLMGWESSSNTLTEIKLEFSSMENAISYAKKNKLDFEIIKPQKSNIIKKSYADNFTK